MAKWALVTGASRGIGLALSRQFAEHRWNLVLVARDRQALTGVAADLRLRHRIEALAVPQDLSRSGAAETLFREVAGRGLQIEALVNNAGFALHGRLVDHQAAQETDLLQVNVVVPTVLSLLFGLEMARRGSGRILNVASTAAFQPGPLLATYYASKAYLLSLSEALTRELGPDGVVVTALCPGATRTEFFQRAGMARSRLARGPSLADPQRVAAAGYAGLMQGKPRVVPGAFNRLGVFLATHLPRSLSAAAAGYFNQKRGEEREKP